MDQSLFNNLISNWSAYSLPLAVVIASLLGSSHCASMCGPISIVVKNSRGHLTLYHAGRLISYLALGSFAGLLGDKIFSENLAYVSNFSFIAITVFLVFAGLRLFFNMNFDFNYSGKFSRLLHKPFGWALRQRPVIKSFSIGVINGFIPCGWVYLFIAGAIATRSALYGAVVIVFFWIGTVPALTFLSFAANSFLSRFPRTLNRTAGLLLISVSVFNFYMIFNSDGHNHDHETHNHSQIMDYKTKE